jgi:hypothetical protein
MSETKVAYPCSTINLLSETIGPVEMMDVVSFNKYLSALRVPDAWVRVDSSESPDGCALYSNLKTISSVDGPIADTIVVSGFTFSGSVSRRMLISAARSESNAVGFRFNGPSEPSEWCQMKGNYVAHGIRHVSASAYRSVGDNSVLQVTFTLVSSQVFDRGIMDWCLNI